MGEEARYSVGIDLGTTNSAIARADLTSGDAAAIEGSSDRAARQSGRGCGSRFRCCLFLYTSPASSISRPTASASMGGR